MSSLTILTKENPQLRQKTKKIAKITPEIKQLILDMETTMEKNQGVGLAAPQVGHSICLCIIKTEKGILTLINPKIIWKSLLKDTEEEGCLSCPQIFGLVKRSKAIKVKALNQAGEPVKFKAKGFLARVIQHEVDHLDGVLIVDKFIKSPIL
jgi:peptide deformylase